MQTLHSSPSRQPALSDTQFSREPVDVLRLLPASPLARLAVWIVVGAIAVLVFGAWLRPNMVFDLADMVFCN